MVSQTSDKNIQPNSNNGSENSPKFDSDHYSMDNNSTNELRNVDSSLETNEILNNSNDNSSDTGIYIYIYIYIYIFFFIYIYIYFKKNIKKKKK